MSEGINEGLREHQTNKAVESQLKILGVLSYDELWHRYSDLQKETKISTKTLSKQLLILEKIRLIQKDGNKSGKYSFKHSAVEEEGYPYPAYYRLNPIYVNTFRGYNQDFPKEKLITIKSKLLDTKNPLKILKDIAKSNNIAILGILLFLKEHRNADDKVKRLLLEYLVWNEYKSLTWKLIEEAEKVIDSIDIRKLVEEV